jgi:quercetin dioxygenase-like cupin family protein
MAGIGLDRVVLAMQDGVKRTILMRADDPAGPGYEAVMGLAEIAPGASIGKHRHYGIELAYVLEGSVVVERDGQPSVTFRTGDPLKNVGAHDARNPGSTPARLLAVYIVEQGKPLAEPVK